MRHDTKPRTRMTRVLQEKRERVRSWDRKLNETARKYVLVLHVRIKREHRHQLMKISTEKNTGVIPDAAMIYHANGGYNGSDRF